MQWKSILLVSIVLAASACAETLAPDLDTSAEEGTQSPNDGGGIPEAQDSTPPTPPIEPGSIPGLDAAFAGRYHAIADLTGDASGGLHALLVDRGNGGGQQSRIVYASYVDSVWSDPFSITEGGASVAAPRLAVDGSGAVHAFWLENSSGGYELMHRARTAQGWSAVSSIHSERTMFGGVGFAVLDAATDPAGRVFVTMLAESSGRLVTYVLEGETFGETGGYGAAGHDIRMAADAAGGVALLVNDFAFTTEYVEGEPWVPEHALFLRDLGDDAPAGAALVHTTPNPIAATALALDAAGVRHALFVELMDGSATLFHTSSADGTSFGEPVPLAAATDFSDPVVQLAEDAAGRVHAVFYTPTYGIARMTLSGGAWSAPEIVTPSAHPQFAITRRGDDVVLVWRDGSGYRFASL